MHQLHRRLWAKRRLPFLRISINQDNPSKLEKREANLKLTQLLRGIVGIALMESFSREGPKPLVTDFSIHHLMWKVGTQQILYTFRDHLSLFCTLKPAGGCTEFITLACWSIQPLRWAYKILGNSQVVTVSCFARNPGCIWKGLHHGRWNICPAVPNTFLFFSDWYQHILAF